MAVRADDICSETKLPHMKSADRWEEQIDHNITKERFKKITAGDWSDEQIGIEVPVVGILNISIAAWRELESRYKKAGWLCMGTTDDPNSVILLNK